MYVSTRIAVLDYGIGNLASVAKGLHAVGATVSLVTNANEVNDVDGIVLPGVGSFGSCARAMRRCGFDETIYQSIQEGIPTLGVCVGLQLFYEGSDESPLDPGLGIFVGQVRRIESGTLRVPHMQWNQLEFTENGAISPLFKGVGTNPWMYFVHSYAAFSGPEVTAMCNYGDDLVAAAEIGNLYGTQFHPEKSSKVGLKVLENFLDIVAAS